MSNHRRHLIVVEAYQGQAEFLSCESEAWLTASGLGLPLAEIAERLDARITVLTWDAFLQLEESGKSFVSWMPVPATKLANDAVQAMPTIESPSPRVRRVAVPARDPEHSLPLALAGLSKLSHGLLADSDPLFYLSYCLDLELRALQKHDPFETVLVPMWGGLGYVAQMSRATGVDGHVAAPFTVVVTDTSENRQISNEEGLWNRQAVTRRQSEALSLALADLVIVFGERGRAIARSGSLRGSPEPICAPRWIPESVLEGIERAATESHTSEQMTGLFLYEPCQPASGVLAMLDAVKLLYQQGAELKVPIACGGPPMVFAPMAPKGFEEYWSSRPFVRELIDARYWRFCRERPTGEDCYPVRIYPHLFAHLPDVWTELARGSHVLLAPAASEGLITGGVNPVGCSLGNIQNPQQLGEVLSRTEMCNVAQLDEARRKLCWDILAAYRGPLRVQALEALVGALDTLCSGSPQQRDLGRAARLLLDRRKNLSEFEPAAPLHAQSPVTNGRLTVVVTCCDMGELLRATVESVWRSDHKPDELLIIDDGSRDRETLDVLTEIESEAVQRGHNIKLIHQRNGGLAAARNRGIEAATGEFISFIDGDDIIEPAFYRLAMRVLKRYPDLGGVAAWSEIFDESGCTGFWNAPQAEVPFQYTENCIFVPCLVRTAFLRQLGGYDTRQRYNYEDWELTCRILASGKPIVTIPAYLQRYRIRRTSMLRTMTPVQNQVMRELFLGNHRGTISSFTVELTMLVENRLMHQLQRRNEEAAANSRRAGVRLSEGILRFSRTARMKVGIIFCRARDFKLRRIQKGQR